MRLPDSIRNEVRMTDDGDSFGNVASWAFAVCHELHRIGSGIPHCWGFRPGAAGVPDREDDGFPGECVDGMSEADLLEAGEVLLRWWSKLEAAGKAY